MWASLPHSIWDLSFLTRDQNWALAMKTPSPNHWIAREFPISHDFDQALGDIEGQGSLACCSPWGHKESDMTE